MKPPLHTERVVVFSVIYHQSQLKRERNIKAFGAFAVEYTANNDIIFTRHHRVYSSEAPITAYRDMIELTNRQTDCVCAVILADDGEVAEPMTSSNLMTLINEAFPIADRLQHRRLHVFQTNERRIRFVARFYDTPLAVPDASSCDQARWAADHAQALWLVWVHFTLTHDPDGDDMIAAFQAWRKLNELRPIFF